ncbi:c-type cytochrome [Octadecabacter sp. R77987]|uniref:c-type cytochrome n=1 Tax=Octadecabacter sp. R77987 TaxID=3093874 RepID=UPI0036726A9E
MRRFVKIILSGGALGAVIVGALMAWPIGRVPDPITLTGDVGRGAYLARVSGCIACHTDVEAGGAPLAGGAGLATDFGTFYPPNLTTDPEHGIGNWVVEDFAAAIRQGISPEGAPYYPAFSYPFYGDFTDQDIADLWAAFQTVAPVAEPAHANEVAFPFDQRWGLKLWRAAFLYDPPTEPVTGKSDQWNRGRELVNGAGHCAACHTPRNLAGGRDLASRFAGNLALPGGSSAPSIQADDLLADDWTVANLAYALRTGITPSGDAFGGSMVEVVQMNTKFLTPQDLEAMATYLLEGDALIAAQ